MKKLILNNQFSCLTLLSAVFCFAIAMQYSAESSGFPRIIASLLAVLAIVDVIKNARAPADEPEVTSPLENQNHRIVTLLVFLSAPAYVVLARFVDFEIATFVYLFAGMYLLDFRKPAFLVLISISVLLVVKGLFFVLLDVTRSPTLIFGT